MYIIVYGTFLKKNDRNVDWKISFNACICRQLIIAFSYLVNTSFERYSSDFFNWLAAQAN